MSLVFASITPHPPIIIPSIGGDNLKQVEKTAAAMKKLEQDLYIAKPETVIVISPHGPLLPNNFTINLQPAYGADFEQFGDFETRKTYRSDVGLIDEIREEAKDKIPLNLISEPRLDHGAGVPLFYLANHLPDIKIIPIGFSYLDLAAHYKFGQFLKKIIIESNKRVAVVASGDLSHRLTPEAPAGFSPQGEKFDKELVERISNKQTEDILKMENWFVEEAGECGLRSFIILLGILDEMEYKPEVLSYEGPFGVGYLVANFVL